eukprot:gene19300-27340_t
MVLARTPVVGQANDWLLMKQPGSNADSLPSSEVLAAWGNICNTMSSNMNQAAARTDKIMVVDDDARIRDLLRRYLTQEGFEVLLAADSKALNRVLTRETIDLIVLDLMLPGEDGLSICRRLRAANDLTPIIMLTGQTSDSDTILGLDSGANDYITKPFSPRELVARLKAVLRRAGPTDGEAPIEVGGLLLDPISHRVTIDGKPAEMGPTEYRLLQFFMTHQERAYTRGQLLDQVWGGNVYVEERTVDVHIRRLRKALGDAYENL